MSVILYVVHRNLSNSDIAISSINGRERGSRNIKRMIEFTNIVKSK